MCVSAALAEPHGGHRRETRQIRNGGKREAAGRCLAALAAPILKGGNGVWHVKNQAFCCRLCARCAASGHAPTGGRRTYRRRLTSSGKLGETFVMRLHGNLG
jgi:hypothetical protein